MLIALRPLSILNRMIFTYRLLFIASLLLVSNAQAAKGQLLQDYVNNLVTFKADFVQTQPDESTFTENRSQGLMELSRPGRLIWLYQQPTEQKIVVDSENLWVYDLDLDQVSVRPIKDIKNEIPLSWLLYNEPIEQKYDIIESTNRNGMNWFNLTPKSPTFFQSIDVGMKNGEMVEVWMYQGIDNITKVKFRNIESNKVIPLQRFQFEVPAGIDLIGQPK